jgi:hypothetical protein
MGKADAQAFPPDYGRPDGFALRDRARPLGPEDLPAGDTRPTRRVSSDTCLMKASARLRTGLWVAPQTRASGPALRVGCQDDSIEPPALRRGDQPRRTGIHWNAVGLEVGRSPERLTLCAGAALSLSLSHASLDANPILADHRWGGSIRRLENTR